MFRIIAAVSLSWVLLASPSLFAHERYFVLVFGSQQVPPDPRYSHSWAVFVRVSECPEGPALDYHTISWLSIDGRVRLWTLLPETGRNWELHETLHYALSTGQRVSLWGPYEIEPELYYKSIRQLQTFDRWDTKYKAVDSGYPTFLASNCIHALSATVGVNRLRVASPSWGETASWFVTRRYSRFFVDKHHKHCWLIPTLGLDQYPIIYRDLQPPRSGAIWTAIRQLTGRPLE